MLAVRFYIRLAIATSLLTVFCVAQPLRPPFPGRIKLPPDFHITPWFGIDTYCGEIKNNIGIVINYDIGEMAGVATANSTLGEASQVRTDQHLPGEISRRVVPLPHQIAVVVVARVGRATQLETQGKSAPFDPDLRLLAISFPYTYSNFYAYVHTQAEIDQVEKIALSYIPQSLVEKNRDVIGSRLEPYLNKSPKP